MNTFKKKSLYLAVAGVSALGAGSASAVSLNADGLGQVLIYPYYTVRLIGGVLVLFGMFLMAYNVIRTLQQRASSIEQQVMAPTNA